MSYRGKVVRVYRNLARDAYSIMSMERGPKYMRVIDIQNTVTLVCCVPIVQPAGQRKVVESGQRNVHAFIEGVLRAPIEVDGSDWKRIKYNPHTDPTFMVGGEPMKFAGIVTLDRTGAYGLGVRTSGQAFNRRDYTVKQQMDLARWVESQRRAA